MSQAQTEDAPQPDQTPEREAPEVDQVVGYVEDPEQVQASEQVDVFLYGGDSSDEGFEEFVEEVDAEVEVLSENGKTDINGLSIINDGSGAGLDDPSLLEEDVGVDDFYAEEELEEIAEEISGEYRGALSGVPILGSVLNLFMGSDVDSEDLNLDNIGEYKNEAHEAYEEAMEAYESITGMVESSENPLVVGADRSMAQKIHQEYQEDIEELIPEGAGYVEFGVSENGDLVADQSRPQRTQEDAQGGQEVHQYAREVIQKAQEYDDFEQAYEEVEEEVDGEVQQQLERVRPQMEQAYRQRN